MKMNFKDTEREKLDWITLTHDRITWQDLVNNVMEP
jgi:hypothetical protein